MAHRLLLCTSWFRPQLGRDMGVDLLDRLRRSGCNLAGVVGPSNDKLADEARRRGIEYFSLLPEFRWPSAKIRRILAVDEEFRRKLDDWVRPIQALRADLGVLYFATWIPPALLTATARGWLNFHPAPLPELRGFLPEDFALLWGWKKMRGTLHVATDGIDEGDIVLLGPYAHLSRWDTPDSVMQKVGETATKCLVHGIKLFLSGKCNLVPQNHVHGFTADYKAFYPLSFVQWQSDSHETLLRKFQTFRGQAHRVELKAQVGNELWRVEDLELHRLSAIGEPGELLGVVAGASVVRTTEGVALVKGNLFCRDPGLPDHLDASVQRVLAPGKRPSTRSPLLKAFRATG